jgi:hypothetical protein
MASRSITRRCSEESPPQEQDRKETDPAYRSPLAQHSLKVDVPRSSLVLGRFGLQRGR